LGKGLDAILGERSVPKVSDASRHASTTEISPAGGPLQVPIERISPGKGQPRRHFADDALEELAASIREKGILQPLVVTAGSGGYELIAGERRLRAAARAGLDTVPVIVRRDVADDELLELALIENIQREDLTPIEQARAYQRLLDDYGYTQEDVARRVGKSRAAVANSIRLLGLPSRVRDDVDSGVLSEGHARALLGLPTAAAQIQLAQRIARKGLSVRETEEVVRAEGQHRTSVEGTKKAHTNGSADLKALETRLTRTLGTKVRIGRVGKRGTIRIEFYSDEELDRLVRTLGA